MELIKDKKMNLNRYLDGLPFPISLLAVLLLPSYVYADTPIATTSVVRPPFKLVAKKVEISLDQLKDVGHDLKHILSICGHLNDEVMDRPVDVITEPEMIGAGAGVVINLPVAVEPIGPPRPPHKERVD